MNALPVAESTKRECQACPVADHAWTRLLVCLSCGWVACSDDARGGGHARAHYEETDHPVVASLEPGSTWRYCYVHRRNV
ncbi:UBP-type zinc finger domain-containing protein [Nonomuraea sp. NPDC049709]|uniref:UBP-type zinc finger domain-containing protein n=1 Tax=Nonomuraea sp. NPDC049709 TaxID=3154736 RepID=UPI00342FC21B